MKSRLWFAITVILMIFVVSAALDWVATPPNVQAAHEAPIVQEAPDASTDGLSAGQTRSLEKTSPVVQVAAGCVVMLFGALAFLPVMTEEQNILKR